MTPQCTLIHNVNGYTWAEGRLQQFEALCFKGDRILATARNDKALDRKFNVDRYINGNDNTLLPGLTDAHGHTLELGYSLMNVDLSEAGSLQEAQNRISEHASRDTDRIWIEGRGWDQARWQGDRYPTATDIDRVVSDQPVWLVRKDHHAGWANGEAMRRAGITKETQAPEGGVIVRDELGAPTGVFIDEAMKLIEDHIPPNGPAQNQNALQRALEHFRSLGLTTVHDACMGPDKFELLQRCAENNDLTTRVYAMVDGRSDFYEEWLRYGPKQQTYDNYFTVRSVKFFADGALGSRGAAMLEPYEDQPEETGMLFYGVAELAEKIQEAKNSGFQVNIHAIGDRANRTVLEAHETADRNAADNDLRHRVEHAQIVKPSDIHRFRQLGLVASIQPAHAMGDMGMVEKRLGERRMQGAYAWQSFVGEKVPIAAGSDFPIESANPFYGMQTATCRCNQNGMPPGGWYPQQGIDLETAFHAYTMGASYAARQEEVLGSIEPGKKADFIMVDRDPFRVMEAELHKVNVLQTWVGGEKVYAID